MTGSILIAGRGSATSERLRRTVGKLKLLVGLLAIYGPVAMVVLTHRHIVGAIYLVLGAWAAAGICWYAFDQRFGTHQRARAGTPG
jgi:xanthine/uracil/vitamin C permease (AzgA family)